LSAGQVGASSSSAAAVTAAGITLSTIAGCDAIVDIEDSYFSGIDLSKVLGASHVSLLNTDGGYDRQAVLKTGDALSTTVNVPVIALKSANGFSDYLYFQELDDAEGVYKVTGFDVGVDNLIVNGTSVDFTNLSSLLGATVALVGVPGINTSFVVNFA
jgi:hypothetical protein